MKTKVTSTLGNPKGYRIAPWMMERLFVIDPSTKALGWAMFAHSAEGSLHNRLKAELVKSGVVNVSAVDNSEDPLNWVSRIDAMVELTLGIYHDVLTNEAHTREGVTSYRVLIELPGVIGSAKGAAANNSGAIMKLMGCVFALRQAFSVMIQPDCHGEDLWPTVELVPVNKWKGTTPKLITQKRIIRAWGWDGTDHNEADAVGIGDWWLRKQRGFTRCGT